MSIIYSLSSTPPTTTLFLMIIENDSRIQQYAMHIIMKASATDLPLPVPHKYILLTTPNSQPYQLRKYITQTLYVNPVLCLFVIYVLP